MKVSPNRHLLFLKAWVYVRAGFVFITVVLTKWACAEVVGTGPESLLERL